MKVKDLKPNQHVDFLRLKISSLSDSRVFSGGRVQDGVGHDETGSVYVVFWGGDCDQFSAGNEIVIKNGWCKVWRGKLQVSAGKYGTVDPAGPERE